MPLSPPSVRDHSSILVDWLELCALAARNAKVSLYEIRNSIDLSYDPDDGASGDVDLDREGKNVREGELHKSEDFSELDTLIEATMSSASAEIDKRLGALKGAYPFFATNDSLFLKPESEWNAGGVVYLFCLALSHADGVGLLQAPHAPKLTNKERNLFQACATLSAAGLIRGNAISFGWPRPDGSSIRGKLTSIYKGLNPAEVRVKETPAPGTSPKAKDNGIDVIAWRTEPDGEPGLWHLLGQAASGKNWSGKSVRPELGVFFETWLHPAPVPHLVIPAMFIPFCITAEMNSRNGYTSEESRSGIIKAESGRLGYLAYRYRLPFYAAAGIALAGSNAGLVIERADEIDKLTSWISVFRKNLSGVNQ